MRILEAKMDKMRQMYLMKFPTILSSHLMANNWIKSLSINVLNGGREKKTHNENAWKSTLNSNTQFSCIRRRHFPILKATKIARDLSEYSNYMWYMLFQIVQNSAIYIQIHPADSIYINMFVWACQHARHTSRRLNHAEYKRRKTITKFNC